jgi:galactitol PTS system EIIA component
MSISSLLPIGAVKPHFSADTASEVIEVLGGILSRAGYVKPGFVAATLAREATMPTGLPLGGPINAAIPHVDAEYVERPALALATLETPVIFRNMVDPEAEVPVRLVIMLALDHPKSQVEMLQQVAEILQSPSIVDRLMAANSPDEIMNVLKSVGGAAQS